MVCSAECIAINSGRIACYLENISVKYSKIKYIIVSNNTNKLLTSVKLFFISVYESVLIENKLELCININILILLK